MKAVVWEKSVETLKRNLPTPIWEQMRRIATGFITPIRFSRVTGHWRSSLRGAACDVFGNALPWYTYPAIEFLKQRDFTNRRILEFGGGQSTFWWSKRALSVFTVEEDFVWHESLRREVNSNVTLHHICVDKHTRSIESIRRLLDEGAEAQQFDIIVIDGHLRRELTCLAFDYLTEDGALLLDDAEGYGFYEELKDRQLLRVDFYGFAPGVSKRHCTSLVFGPDCFLFQQKIPIVAIEAELRDQRV